MGYPGTSAVPQVGPTICAREVAIDGLGSGSLDPWDGRLLEDQYQHVGEQEFDELLGPNNEYHEHHDR